MADTYTNLAEVARYTRHFVSAASNTSRRCTPLWAS